MAIKVIFKMKNFLIMKNTKILKAIILMLVFFSSVDVFAAEDDSMQGVKIFNYLALLILGIVLISAMVYAIQEKPLEDAEPAKAKDSLLKKVMGALTKSTPISKEQDIMLNHEYDGIRELNNSVPPWLNYIFIGSLVFAIFYLLHFHVLGTGKSQFDEYSHEMEVASMEMELLMQSGAFITEENVTPLEDEASLTAGKERFTKDCTPCHGVNGEGTIGPNLTDDYWIHGGKVSDLFHTVKVGVPEKGMVAWGTQLNPKQIQEVVSYVMTLRGTNPPNGKAPEGELYVPEGSGEKKDSTKVEERTDTTSTQTDTTK